MARKTKAAELTEFMDKNNVYVYGIHYKTYTIRVAVFALTEYAAKQKIDILYPHEHIVYLSQANRLIL